VVTKYTLFAQKLHVTTKYDFEYLSLQTEMHASESLVPEPSLFDVEIAIEKLERYKSLGINQILSELIKQEVIYYGWILEKQGGRLWSVFIWLRLL
jgi:hypothetical protein